MITKIKSKRINLPPIYLIETKEDFDTLPKGLPYIVGQIKDLPFITIFLEFQTLLRSCNRTGLPIKWMDCLKRLGYNPSRIKNFTLNSGGSFWESGSDGTNTLELDDFIEEEYLVNFDKLSELKILPKWLDDITESVKTNIIDEVQYDPTAFNKQLGMNIGYGSVKHNLRNLLILDVSASIPTSVAVTISNLAKLMSKKFYADIIITSSKSQFIDYDDVFDTDIVALANSWSRGNESEMYKAIVEQEKQYNTVICFGDNDNPINSGSREINSKFKVETLYSLHTDKNTNNIAGYGRVFKPKTTHIVKDWVTSIK
jgi:hypothetical protein